MQCEVPKDWPKLIKCKYCGNSAKIVYQATVKGDGSLKGSGHAYCDNPECPKRPRTAEYGCIQDISTAWNNQEYTEEVFDE